MIELYKILTGKYDASVSSSLVTLRDNDSDTTSTRGHNLKYKKRYRLNIKNTHLYTDAQMYGTAFGGGCIYPI